MNRLPKTLLALAAVLAAGSAGADSLSLRFSNSIYQDDKDIALHDPDGVACTDSTLVVADTANARFVKYQLQNGAPVSSAVMKIESFQQPTALQFDTKGNLFVLDRKARRIGRIDPQGAFGGWVELKGIASPEAVVPVAFKVDGSDGFVLLDAPARRVLVLDPAGQVTRQVPLPPGEFTDVAVDPAGVLFAVDSTDSVVWGAEKGATAFKALSKSLKDVLVFPAFLVATPKGVLLVADQHGHGVVLVGNDGAFLGRQLGQGFIEGNLYYPSQICMNGKGEVFVADRYNNRVQVFVTQR